MKSLLINLIVAIFLISCAPTIRPYKNKDCSYILKRKAELKEEIKQIKATSKYKKETKEIVMTAPVLIPLLLWMPFLEGLFEDTTSEHHKVQYIEREYDDLKNEDKYFKHCSKDH